MCFSIPYQVMKVKKNTALIEGGKEVTLGSDVKVKPGDYVQIVDNIAVGKISKAQGLKIRQLIKRLNQ